MTFGSLFTGIGGMDRGLERAGMRCSWQVETDAYAQTILRKHWPDVPKFCDVRFAGIHSLARVDLIAGGFPCQDLSLLGKKAGLEGERSGLWREFARIIDELRPDWVIIENVPALRKRGLRAVLSHLDSCGYDAEWDCLPASAFGAHHRRDRLFVVANSCGQRLEGRLFAGAEARAALRSVPRWPAEPGVARVVHGLPARVDRIRGLGNSIVPVVAEFIGRRIMEVAP